MNNKAILVTGSHRSGSTWAGKILATAPKTVYIHEPFNINVKSGQTANLFNDWYKYICKENSDKYKSLLKKEFTNQYALNYNLKNARTLRNIARIVRDQSFSWFQNINNYTPIIKDPIALFSAEWLYREFDLNVLVMIRHPAAFCSSLKIKNWRFDFNVFLNQPLLMDKYLDKFRDQIIEYEKNGTDIIDEAILLWNCIHHTISIYNKSYPDWHFVKHEELSYDPVNRFKPIFDDFNLNYTPDVISSIIEKSGSHNPIEQQPENEFIRDSKKNIFNWKKRLTTNEINRIMTKTSDISSLFYTDKEW